MDVPEQNGNTQPIEQPKEEALHAGHYTYSVLTVGTELAVLSPESPVRKRIFSYGKRFKAMHVVLMSGVTGQGAVHEDSVTVYPTNSSSKISRYSDALRIGKNITGIDIVSAQDPFEIGFISWLIARHHKVPLHVQIHTDFLTPEYAAHSMINAIRVMIASFVIKRATHVRVVSKVVADQVVAKFGPKLSISILPIYIDVEHFRTATIPPGMSQRFMTFPHRALVVSRFEPEKNISLAVRAFAESAPKDACLILLGQGSEYTVLERLVTKLGLDARVFFEGHQDPAPYYALSEILLVPSIYEGYGQVIIEALAAQKPVLATDVGIARESGAIIASPQDFTKALKEWYENGSRTGALQKYPYGSMDAYVEQYCADIALAKKETTAA